MRRVLVAGASIVVLAVVGVLAAIAGAGTVGAPAPASAHAAAHARDRPAVHALTVHALSLPPARAPNAVLPEGSTCFVAISRCSETPCVELIGSSGSRPAVLGSPSVTPSETCKRPRPQLPGTVIVARPAPSVTPSAPLGHLTARLPALARELRARQR